MKQRYLWLLLFSVLVVQAGPAAAQPAETGVTTAMRNEANQLFTKQEWEKALKAYENISAIEPSNAGALTRVGVSQLNLKQYESAAQTFERVLKLTGPGVNRPVIMYHLAASNSKLGKKAQALEWLTKSVESGSVTHTKLSSDEDLVSIRSEPQFSSIVAKAKALTLPCTARPEYRQLDFWIGEWDVKTPTGQATGATSIVQLILNECVIFENWTGSAMSGKSFNMFNASTGKWEQHWMDTTSRISVMTGEFKDGSLMYNGERVAGEKKIPTRMSFTKLDGDKVRQFGEESTDNGKTWSPTFELIYHRKKLVIE